VYSPAEDWDFAWPKCKWRKMSVWALIRGQEESQPPNTETLQFLHYFFHLLIILIAHIFVFVESPVSLFSLPKVQSDAAF